MNILNSIFTPINNFLSGKKLIIGMISATGAFLTAIATIFADGVQVADWTPLVTAFSAYMIAIGAGHRLQKIDAAVKNIVGK